MATGRVAELQEEIERHELVHDMLVGRKTGKRSRQVRSGAGALRRGPRGAMIDWAAVLATLPNRFTLDSLAAHETAGGKSRPTSGRWSRGGPRKAGSGAPAGACTRRPDRKQQPDGTGGTARRPARSRRLVSTAPHTHIAAARVWAVGNDSLFNGRSATLRCRIPQWLQSTEGDTRDGGNRKSPEHGAQGDHDQDTAPGRPVRIDRTPKEGRGLSAGPARSGHRASRQKTRGGNVHAFPAC